MRKRRKYPSSALNRYYKKNAEKKRIMKQKEEEVYTPKVYCYLRVSTEMQTVESQKIGVESLAKKKGLTIDEYIVDNGVSGTVNANNRNLGKLLRKMRKGDILICSELSRLSRSMIELISMLQSSLQKGCKIYSDKEGYELGDNIEAQVIAFAFSLCADIERRMISQRTKEGLARAKANGKTLGRPKGFVCKHHITDGKDHKYKMLRLKGLSKIQIAKKFRMSYKTIQNWVKSKDLDKDIKFALVKTKFKVFDKFANKLNLKINSQHQERVHSNFSM